MSQSPDQVAARARAAAAQQAQEDGYVSALLRERNGYVTRGLDDRVEQVDAELTRVGAGKSIPRTRAPKTDPAAQTDPAA